MGSFSHSLCVAVRFGLGGLSGWIGALGGRKMDRSSRSFSRSLCVAVRFGLSLRSFSHSLSVLRDPEMN